MAANQSPLRAAIIVLLGLAALAYAWHVAPALAAAQSGGSEPLFLGPSADHFVDPTGALSLADVVRDPSRFIPANGKVASHGFAGSSQAALWLRVPIPDVSDRLRVLSVELQRVLRADVWWPSADGFGHAEWDTRADAAQGRALMRHPAFDLPAGEVAGRTIYVRINTTSSMRALIWLRTQRAYVVDLAWQNAGFGLLMGIHVGLFAYLLAAALALRDASLGALAANTLAFLAYLAADQGYVETALVPGAFTLSRIVSITATLLIHASWLLFANLYLGLPRAFPRLSRAVMIVAGLFALWAVEAGTEAAFDIRLLRLWSPLAGIAALSGGLALALLVLTRRDTRRRGFSFLLCWTPAVASGVMHLLPNATPSVGASPILVDSMFVGVTLSLLAFGLAASFHIQKREHALLAATQESEARFRSFAESASDSYWQTDPSGAVAYAAGLVAEAAGMQPGRSLAEALAQAGAEPGEIGPIEHRLAEARSFRSLPATIRGADGEVRHIAISGIPLHGPDGAATGFRGVISDVTSERKAAERQAQQQKMAALGQLAGGIAHEINNLLHPIINMSRRMRDGTPPGDPKRYQLDLVVDAGLRASEIVAAVLTTARPSPGELQRLPLRDCLERSLDAVRPILPQAIDLTYRHDGSTGPLVSPGEMMQVIGNLVGNAVQAISGRGRIAVSLTREGADRIVLEVADSGHGMSPETLARALEPFFSTRTAEGGTGLGLSIVGGIVSSWRGALDIASEPGRGTRIRIIVPNQSEQLEEADHAGAALAGAGG